MMPSFTILFDLDDTLIHDEMESIHIPAYLDKLSVYMSKHVTKDAFRAQLMQATQCMVENDSPEFTLEQTFDESFYTGIGLEKSDVKNTIDQFYEQEYPLLKEFTREIPAAIQLMDQVVRENHNVVIATNPLFPKIATHQRLSWAALPIKISSIALISSFESFHFSKPNPAYYAEILAQLGWPTQPAVMIGNDWSNDIKAASEFGIPAFWVTDQSGDLPIEAHPLSSQGTLSDVLPWLYKLSVRYQKNEFKTPEAILSVLKSTPAALSTLSKDLNTKAWKQKPLLNEWNAVEILCHLMDVDLEINLPRLKKLTTEDNPFIPGEDADVWAEDEKYKHGDGPTILRSFIQARSKLLNSLSKLTNHDWQRPARHSIFGPTTVLELMGFIASHDQSHVRQFMNAISPAPHLSPKSF
jgi:FMN phosphatase YigB (HAD superfamily)